MPSRTAVAAGALLMSASVVALAATHRADQQPGTPADVASGAKLYTDNCAVCHGAGGEGMARWAPRLDDQAFLGAVSNEFLATSITKGRQDSTMVSWDTIQSHADAGLKKKQVGQMVAFLRSWQTVDGVELDESPLEGDVARGERIYEVNCVECHGAQGSAADQAAVTIAIGNKAYMSAASDGYLRAVFGTRCKDLREVAEKSPIPAESDFPLHYSATQRDSLLLYLREKAW